MNGARLCRVLLFVLAVGLATAEHHDHDDHGHHVDHHGQGHNCPHCEHHGHAGHRDGPRVSAEPMSVTSHAAGHDDHHDDHHDDDDHGDHVQAFTDIDHRLDALTSRMGHLRGNIHQRVNPKNMRLAGSFRQRVMRLTGTGCDDRHFQCGGNDPECHSYLFVCDGHKDCRNGADEAHCELPTKKGDYFEGHMLWDTCTQRKPHLFGLEIMSVTTSNFFTPIARLTANMILEYEGPLIEGRASLPTVGAYHFGRRVVAFAPPESDKLMFFCKFDGFDLDTCHGFIAHEASGDVCAELTFHRKHDDDHHDDHDDHHDDEDHYMH